jgi:hypothetical protein
MSSRTRRRCCSNLGNRNPKYANGPTGLRFDAIAHRDVTSAGAALALDGSVFVPVISLSR